MRLYHLKTNITRDLQEGYYTRGELGIDGFTLLNMIENGDIEVTNDPIKCILITDNDFKRTITLPNFRQVVEIPIREAIDFQDELKLNRTEELPKLGRDTFVFQFKVRGKNKFIYRQS